jgi:hypothetical protein
LFPRETDSLDHPEVKEFQHILEGMAGAYGGRLTSFAVDRGVVAFGVDNEEMARDMRNDLARLTGNPPVVCADEQQFREEASRLLGERRGDR